MCLCVVVAADDGAAAVKHIKHFIKSSERLGGRGRSGVHAGPSPGLGGLISEGEVSFETERGGKFKTGFVYERPRV